jgi:aminoglycoside N3'-acetyltransferase
MKKLSSDFIKKIISLVLTQETGNTLNESIYKFKIKNKRLFRLLYGTAEDEDVFNNILQRIDGRFEILMVHSSLAGMMPMYSGNISKLLNMLIVYCKQNNITIAMPAFLMGSNYQVIERYTNGKNTFDISKTASEMGMLSELFRRTTGVKRSIHPANSICALGPLAENLTRNHHLADTTFGEGTPFDEMIKHRTIILGIGIESENALTQIHAVEDIMKDRFPIPLYTGMIPVTCYNERGKPSVYNLRIKNTDYTIDPRSLRKILRRIKNMDWTYKGIPFFSVEAKVVTDTFVEAAAKGETMYKKKKKIAGL